jgi:hypothetical protein
VAAFTQAGKPPNALEPPASLLVSRQRSHQPVAVDVAALIMRGQRSGPAAHCRCARIGAPRLVNITTDQADITVDGDVFGVRVQ